MKIANVELRRRYEEKGQELEQLKELFGETGPDEVARLRKILHNQKEVVKDVRYPLMCSLTFFVKS